MFMDPTSVIEGMEEGSIQVDRASKPTSDFAAPKKSTDPVVYKLVRVDFDGRLVPATDNELMEVDDYFDYENSDMFSVADVIQTAGFGFSDDELPDKHFPGGEKDFAHYEYSKGGEEKSHVGVECDEMLRRVAEEERHRSTSSSPIHLLGNINDGESGFDQQIIMDKKDSAEIAQEQILSTSGSTLHDTEINLSGKSEDCSNVEDGLVETEATDSTSSSLKPDFSLLSGEINLDKLTIRELQETFRATFGRGTSVKDKLWLKRRISMGLINSCDIPMTSFIIKDNKLVKKVEDANCEKVEDDLVGEVETVKGAQVDSDTNSEDANSTRLNSFLVGSNDNSPADQRGIKRVRKPTKRYIEESSDFENHETVGIVGKLIPSVKQSEMTKDLSKSTDKPAWESGSSAISMRPDSLGGSGFQVPRVCRIRRCRPRKGIITLTPKILEAGLVGDASSVDGTQFANAGVQKISEARAVPFQELLQPCDEEKSNNLCSEVKIATMDEEQEAKSADSCGYNSNGNFTAKGGMRRKHHRAWSLSEVVKLVDGVSRYGAGRWSEIKRISFASYSYRTSVDLKDKWRNLLKASFAAVPSDKGMSQQQQQQQQRKPTSMPLPTPILLKVRELAELNGQAPRNFKGSGEHGGGGGVTV